MERAGQGQVHTLKSFIRASIKAVGNVHKLIMWVRAVTTDGKIV